MGNTKEEKNSRATFGTKDKVGYAFGDTGNGLMFGFASSYLIVFYTNVLGVNAAIAGVLFLVARFIDAFTDIGMGVIVDHAKPTKDGKFKPWIKRVCVIVTLMSFLMYQSGMASAPMTLKIVYMFVTYILWGSFAYTAINIPYGSMASVVTEDPTNRAMLSTFRSLGSGIAMLVVGIIAAQFLYVEQDGQQVVSPSHFTILAGVISVAALVFYILCFVLSTERVKIEEVPKEQKRPLKASAKNLIGSRSMVTLVILIICATSSTFLFSSTVSYLFINWFNDNNALTVYYLLQLVSLFIIFGLVKKFTERFGKKEFGAVGYIGYGVVFVIMGFLNIESTTVYLVFLFVAVLILAYASVTMWALVTDVIDDIEVQTGDQENGTVYGVFSFSRKAGQALGGGISGLALSAVGYVEGVGTQTAAVNLGIYNIANFLPGIASILAGLVMLFFYPLTKEKVQENSRILAERKGLK